MHSVHSAGGGSTASSASYRQHVLYELIEHYDPEASEVFQGFRLHGPSLGLLLAIFKVLIILITIILIIVIDTVINMFHTV